jgi:hypothetical protein
MSTSALLSWLACAAPPTEVATDSCSAGCLPTTDGRFAGWAQVAVDGAGTAWVSWVEVDGPAITGTYLASSAGRDERLSVPIVVPTPEPPVVGSTEKPSLAASDDRLALGFTSRGTLRHGDAKVAWVQTASLAGDFGEAVAIDSLQADDRVTEQMRVAFSASGELWAAWKRQIYGLEDHPHWAHENDGFIPQEVSPLLSDSHDCSPPDFRFGASDRPLYALRSNVDGWLQSVLVIDGEPPAQVSDDLWAYNPDVCPTDGPRVAEATDGTVVMGWLAPSDDVWRLHTARSTDGGASFGPPELTAGDVGLGERWIAMIADERGVWTAVESVHGTTTLTPPDAPPVELLSPDGLPLSDVELAANAGRVVAVGQDPDGTWWLVDL